jgi:cell wall-associated NlpC family hydrolase
MPHGRVLTMLAGAVTALQLAGCGHTPINTPAPAAIDRAASVAVSQVGSPYRYGGNTPKGFDCSGLVQYSYARAGIRLPHGTEGLRRATYAVPSDRIRRGDLLFFHQEGKRASHVGIYLGNDEFVHAPSSGRQVHVASLSDPYWRRNFAGARRIESD